MIKETMVNETGADAMFYLALSIKFMKAHLFDLMNEQEGEEYVKRVTEDYKKMVEVYTRLTKGE